MYTFTSITWGQENRKRYLYALDLYRYQVSFLFSFWIGYIYIPSYWRSYYFFLFIGSFCHEYRRHEPQSFSSLMVDLLQDKSVSLFRNEKSNKYKSSLLSLLSLSTYSRIFFVSWWRSSLNEDNVWTLGDLGHPVSRRENKTENLNYDAFIYALLPFKLKV